jgi:hypothetical protein
MSVLALVLDLILAWERRERESRRRLDLCEEVGEVNLGEGRRYL